MHENMVSTEGQPTTPVQRELNKFTSAIELFEETNQRLRLRLEDVLFFEGVGDLKSTDAPITGCALNQSISNFASRLRDGVHDMDCIISAVDV
jgi:hypothetical protein